MLDGRIIDDGIAPPAAGANVVIEWAPFRLAPGVAEATLLEASEALQRDFLSHQPGFLRRELLRGKGGEWVDVVYWESEGAADAVMQDAASSGVCHAYFHLMDGADAANPGAGVLHFRRVRVY